MRLTALEERAFLARMNDEEVWGALASCPNAEYLEDKFILASESYESLIQHPLDSEDVIVDEPSYNALSNLMTLAERVYEDDFCPTPIEIDQAALVGLQEGKRSTSSSWGVTPLGMALGVVGGLAIMWVAFRGPRYDR